MERTKYFNNTEPGQDQLNYTEDSRVRGILKRFRASSQFGIISGFRVTINGSDNTRIDIGVGEGYTGGYFRSENLNLGVNSGENIKITSTYSSVGLDDYTLGTVNYVSLVYTETESTPLTERFSPYSAHDTIVSESYSVEVITAAAWAVLSNDEKESRILVATVTAQGAGNPLSLSNVSQVVQPLAHPVPAQPTTITGVVIDFLTSNTNTGTGVLTYLVAGPSLQWTPPNGAAGLNIPIPASGSYTITSADVNYYITVTVDFAALPAGNVTENIEISSLYGRTIPLFSSVDQVHRDMIGTGTVSATNPHGISENDISGGTYEHAGLYHRNGIANVADSDQLECTNDGVDTVTISNKGGNFNKFLINGATYETINGYNAGTDATVLFTGADPDGEYLVYLDVNAAPAKISMSDVLWSAEATIFADVELVDLQADSVGQMTLAWNANNRTLTLTGVTGGAGTPVQVPAQNQTAPFTIPRAGYYKVYGGNTDNWVIVYLDGVADLNTTASVVFNTAYSIIGLPQKNLLKLYKVGWDTVPGTFYDPQDLRRFLTSDTRDITLEEHDITGNHTVPLRNTLNVAAASGYGAIISANNSIALRAVGGNATLASAGEGAHAIGFGSIAANITGVYGWASNYLSAADKSAIGVKGFVPGVSATGVVGLAAAGTALYGSGSLYGGYGLAAAGGIGLVGSGPAAGYGVYGKGGAVGVYGTADVQGVLGSAANSIGVIGSAQNSAIFGIAATDTGVLGSAARSYGVVGSAVSLGVYGIATTGVMGSAVDTGVFGKAATNAIYGLAAGNTGVIGSAVDTGVYGKADTNGIYGSAKNRGVVGYAATDTAVYGLAAVNTGVLGSAVSSGVVGFANTYGAYLSANRNYALYATVVNTTNDFGTDIYGVYAHVSVKDASAGEYAVGGKFEAVNADTADSAIGVMGAVGLGNSAMGVYGYAQQGIGVAGSGAYGVSGTGYIGAVGVGSYYGLYAYGADSADIQIAHGSALPAFHFGEVVSLSSVAANSYIKVSGPTGVKYMLLYSSM